jgi:hypothetical protein
VIILINISYGRYVCYFRPGSLHGSITPREVPAHIPRPEYISTVSSGDRCAEDDTIDGGNGVIAVLEGEDLERMRASCRVAREVLNEAVTAVRPGTRAYISVGIYICIKRHTAR